MTKEYYFVSDLHFGGDGQLQLCDFAAEFIEFLTMLAKGGNDAELILAGDTFGFWELTTVEGPEKFDEIVRHHQAIFEQLRRTGERVPITMMAGNHDYDLACDPVFGAKLAGYNITLDTSISLTREIGGRKIWIEHGQQVDSFNASPAYGDPYALPSGFFITENFVGTASKSSVFGRSDWLKDIRSIAVEAIPEWLASNYFYREMSALLRWVLLPFLVLWTVTGVALVAQALKLLGVFDVNVVLDNPLLRSLGIFGNLVQWILRISMTVWFFVLAVAAPLYLILRDVRRVITRFKIFPDESAEPNSDKNGIYLERAREVFRDHPDVCAYVFGHTHDAFLIEEGGRVVFNTGTWLKILRRVPARFHLLPAVYDPTYRLNFFKAFESDGQIVIDYVEVPKKAAKELTLLERVVTLGRRPRGGSFIPPRTVLSFAGAPAKIEQAARDRPAALAAEAELRPT